MLISLSYYLGESSKYKYFENYEDVITFIKKYLEVEDSDFNRFDLTVYRGKEEQRVRELNKEVKQNGKI